MFDVVSLRFICLNESEMGHSSVGSGGGVEHVLS